MDSNLRRIEPGTNVYDSYGDKVGDVSEVGSNYVLVQKGWLFTRDIYIPLSAVTGVDPDGVRLNVTKDQVENMGWDTIPAEDTATATYSTTTATRRTTDAPATSHATGVDYAASSTVADTGSTAASTVTSTDRTATRSSTSDIEAGREVAIPVVEEELRVGKRAVEGGGVRVTTSVEEVPVNEQVTLREETINVERRPADRPVSDADLTALEQGAFEMRERREEVVVDKQARIVEEVRISKDVGEHTETIEDSVRRTNVEVQEIPGQTRTSGYTETSRTSASDVSGTGRGSATRAGDVETTRPDEGVIERGVSKAENAAERATGKDLNRDGDVGRRDPRNNV